VVETAVAEPAVAGAGDAGDATSTAPPADGSKRERHWFW
jgi:hypothetical protein